MKSLSIFNTALKKLTYIYVWLAVLITLTYTLPTLVAAQRARQRLPAGELATLTLPPDANPTQIRQTLQGFVRQRDDDYNRHLTRNLLQLNGIVLLLAVGASYWLARRTLDPLHDVLNTQEEFAAELAHELKTPLATVLLELESVAREDGLSKQTRSQLRRIAQAVKDVGQLTEQTLSLMAIDHIEPAAAAAVDLNSVAAEAVDLARPAAAAKSIALSYKPLAGTAQLTGHRLPLRQLISILLDNAVKFTPSGGKISVAINERDKKLSVSVRDTGPGIPLPEQEKIFNRWHQGSAAQSGAGLGLAIARRVATAHDGTLTVSSHPGKGATFTLRLPRS